MVVIFERISLEILGKNRLFSIYERTTNSSWYGKSNSSFPSVWKSYNCEKYLVSRRTRKLKFCILLITGARMRTVGSADNFTDVSRGSIYARFFSHTPTSCHNASQRSSTELTHKSIWQNSPFVTGDHPFPSARTLVWSYKYTQIFTCIYTSFHLPLQVYILIKFNYTFMCKTRLMDTETVIKWDTHAHGCYKIILLSAMTWEF